MKIEKTVAIFGAGATGIFSALLLCECGYSVNLYDKNPKIGVKVLLASNSGLNISNNRAPKVMASYYADKATIFEQLLELFSSQDLKQLLEENNIEYFIGNDEKIFIKDPNQLKTIAERLNSYPKFKFFPRHKLTAISNERRFTVESDGITADISDFDYAIIALGGASYPRTGSDGSWVSFFQEKNINIVDFKPVNCGFYTNWSEKLIQRCENNFLKNIELKINGKISKKEIVITKRGLQGPGIYELSIELRREIEKNQKAILEIDLLPNRELDEIARLLEKKSSKESLSNFLRKRLKIDKAKFLLLMEGIKNSEDVSLAKQIKALQIECLAPFPIEEAISVSGGVDFNEVDENFQLKKIPNCFVGGEMLDWEAVTGGFLLHGCLAIAKRICLAIEADRKCFTK
ncbi:MAG: TIGR03862 family flavoprotein [Spirochaetales bacterium]|nr:TIGR03862 family flavoprotein [Spirochaetales bacterium]